MKKLVALILAFVVVFAMSAGISAAETPEVIVKDLKKEASGKSLVKPFNGYNMAIFKKGGVYVIWTDNELTGEQNAALLDAIENAGVEDLEDLGKVSFASGYGEFKINDQTIRIDEEGYIYLESNKTIAWYYAGNYEFPERYEWVKTGEDSATGYDPDGKINPKGNWFMYNTVAVGEWEIDDSRTFDIQAGKPKDDDLNFVGSYTVTKVGEGLFKITYTVKKLDEFHKIEFEGSNLWVNGTGEFQTSPGRQDDAVAVEANVPFEFEGDVLYVYAHFDVVYYELVKVED